MDVQDGRDQGKMESLGTLEALAEARGYLLDRCSIDANAIGPSYVG